MALPLSADKGCVLGVRGLRVTLVVSVRTLLPPPSLGAVRAGGASGPGGTQPVWLGPASLDQQDHRPWDRAERGSAAEVVHDQAGGRGAEFMLGMGKRVGSEGLRFRFLSVAMSGF